MDANSTLKGVLARVAAEAICEGKAMAKKHCEELKTTLVCANCSVSAQELKDMSSETMKTCGNCRKIHYCSKECQIEHFRLHKKECRIMRNPSKSTNPNFELLEKWKEDHKTNLTKISLGLLFPDDEDEVLANSHIAVLQVEYTEGAAVPFQIIDSRAISDNDMMMQEHNINIPRVQTFEYTGTAQYTDVVFNNSISQTVNQQRQARTLECRNVEHNTGNEMFPAILCIIFTGFSNGLPFMKNLCQIVKAGMREDKSMALNMIVPLINGGFGAYNADQGQKSMGFTTTSGELEISEKDYQALIQAANSRSQMREGNNDMHDATK